MAPYWSEKHIAPHWSENYMAPYCSENYMAPYWSEKHIASHWSENYMAPYWSENYIHGFLLVRETRRSPLPLVREIVDSLFCLLSIIIWQWGASSSCQRPPLRRLGKLHGLSLPPLGDNFLNIFYCRRFIRPGRQYGDNP